MLKAIGIDFGTSNSAMGFSENGVPHLFEIEAGKTTIPSAVFYDTKEDAVHFGRAAISALVDRREGRLLRSLKSILGSSLIDESTRIGHKQVQFKEILSHFLGHLKTKAEMSVGSQIDSIVMGRPVWFVDEDEKADKRAQDQLEDIAHSCGFKHIVFQYEPVAAALAYERTATEEELTLIVDIGGGTSDFSVVRISPNSRQNVDRKSDILANTGVHIGGTDLDTRLSLEQVMPLLGYKTRARAVHPGEPDIELPNYYYHEMATWHRIVLMYNNKTLLKLKKIGDIAAQQDLVERFIKVVKAENGHLLAGDVEHAKITLSDVKNATLSLDYIETGLKKSIDREEFEASTEGEREDIMLSIRECITKASVAPSEISAIFLTGGTTAIPSIVQACRKVVPEARLVEGDKFGSVCAGLALDAERKFGRHPVKYDL